MKREKQVMIEGGRKERCGEENEERETRNGRGRKKKRYVNIEKEE